MKKEREKNNTSCFLIYSFEKLKGTWICRILYNNDGVKAYNNDVLWVIAILKRLVRLI
jgi:hypothetical protein